MNSKRRYNHTNNNLGENRKIGGTPRRPAGMPRPVILADHSVLASNYLGKYNQVHTKLFATSEKC
jgi:hypothetical protein